MFKLELKGFNPVKALKVKSKNNLVCFVCDETIGAEIVKDTLVSVQKMLSEERTERLLMTEYVWNVKLGGTLHIAWYFNKQRYISELKKKPRRYAFALEEGYNGDTKLFERTDKLFNNTMNLIDDDQTSWMLKQDVIKQLSNMKAIKKTNCSAWVSDFSWYEYPPLNHYENMAKWLLRTAEHDGVLEEVNQYLPELLPAFPEMELHEDKDIPEYSYIRFKTKDSEEYPTRYSSKVWNTATLLVHAVLGANIFWKPDNLLNEGELESFFSILKSKPYPIFMFLNNPVEGETCYRVSGDQKKVTVK